MGNRGCLESLQASLGSEILILDGPMGTVLHPPSSAKTGDPCDFLNVLEPERVRNCLEGYLSSGAQILRTNTFNSNALSLPGLSAADIRRLNVAGVEIARSLADSAKGTCFVAGVLGPTTGRPDALPRSAFVEAFYAQAAALIDSGADLLLAETITRPETMAAFLAAVQHLARQRNASIPAMVSVAPVGSSPLAVFLDALQGANVLALGINCVSVDVLEPALEYFAANTNLPLCGYPSAGLPAPNGSYPDSVRHIVSAMERLAAGGRLNIAGGCCGTTAELTRSLARSLRGVPPRTFMR